MDQALTREVLGHRMRRQSREIARALKSGSSNMRRLSGTPDKIVVTVTGQRADGMYCVRRDHWPTTIAVPSVPPDAKIPWPTRTSLFLEDGDSQRPFLYWPWNSSKRILTTGEIVSISAWYCEQRDFRRSQSQLVLELDTSSLSEATAPPYGRYDRSYEDYRIKITGSSLRIPRTPGTDSPMAEWLFDSLEAESELGLLNGTYEEWYVDNVAGELEDNQARNHYIDFAEQKSVCIVDGRIYLEIEYIIDSVLATTYDEGTEDEYTDTESDYNPRTMLFCFAADPPASDAELLWSYELDPGRVRLTRSDIVVTGGRCAICYEDLVDIVHVDSATGGDEQTLELTDIFGASSIPTHFAAKIAPDWKQTYADGDFLWIGGDGLRLTCCNLGTNSVVWSQEVDTNTAYHPLGFAGDSLICVYSVNTYETITDYPININPRYYTGTPEPEERPPELARGHSEQTGIVAINRLTGEEIGSTLFAGTENNGWLVESVVDYVTTIATETWVDIQGPDPTLTYIGHDDEEHYTYETASPFGVSSYKEVVNAALGDYFNTLPVPQAYQATNATGTLVEGDAGGADFGPFESFTSSKLFSEELTGTYTYVWQDEWHVKYNKHLNSRLKRGTDPVSPAKVEVMVASMELLQHDVKDWVRADILYSEFSSVALFDVGTFDLNSASSLTQRVIEPGDKEEYDPIVNPLGTPELVGINAHDKLIPSTKPAYGEEIDHFWSLEFINWFKDWDGASPCPWEGVYTYNFTGPAWDEAHPIQRTQSAVWRPGNPPTAERLRTPAPPLKLGPTCATSDLLILGPDSSATSMSWVAVNSAGGIEWESSLAKDGFPGSTLSTGLVGGGEAVLTFYLFGGDWYLVVLDASDGSIIYNDLVPDDGSDAIFDAIIIDQAAWSLGSNYGIELGEI